MSVHSSNITVGNSSFDNNKARCDGGVMYASSSSSITVGNSSFDNNEADEDGGVIYASFSSSITVGNSSFDNNKAHYDGGVMYLSSSSSITVGNSSFDNNEADKYGGVIYASFSSSITVGNSSFDNNKVRWNGGVMSVYSSSITAGNSSFDNNKVGWNGGVMSVHSSSSITVRNSSFDNNKAHYDGGVMHASSSSSITVGNSSFDNNEAGSNGGVMYASSSSSIIVGNSSFDNNEAGSNGGVMYASSSSSITVGNSSFDNNEAGSNGGVMYTSGVVGIIVGNFFGNNEAGIRGGVVYLTSYLLRLSRYNSSTNIRSYYCELTLSTMNVSNCTFSNNSASEGGVAYVFNTSLTDLGSVYSNNMATGNGGVIALNSSYVTVIASSFVSNSAGNNGGVLYGTGISYYATYVVKTWQCTLTFTAFFASLIVTKSTFAHNRASRGGVIYLPTGVHLTIVYSSFLHNLADIDGGAVYSESQNNLIINNSILSNNRAEGNGGVVCLILLSDLIIGGNRSSFFANHAHRGGVVYARGSKIEIISETSVIMGNLAQDNGGAIFLSTTNLTFLSESIEFIRNKALIGGVLYSSFSLVHIHGQRLVLLANNTATCIGEDVCSYSTAVTNDNDTYYGGAVYLSSSKLTFSGASSTLVGNQAEFGGAVYASESKLLIEMDSQTYIDGNIAQHNGGGFYLTMSELNITGYGTYIIRNEARNKGGGIHAANSSIMINGGLHLISNKAKNGGGISLEEGAKLYGISDTGSDIVAFISNRASHHGGALYYVNEESNSTECETIIATDVVSETECFSESAVFNSYDNVANVSHFDLFGGLLDKCTVQNVYMENVSNKSVQLCFCYHGQSYCNYQPETIQINRGMSFSIELIAYHQFHNPVNASIQSSLSSSASSLSEGQHIQSISNRCTELNYTILTPHKSENLTLSTEMSQCNITRISERYILIDISCSCPVGFQMSKNSEVCECICAQVFQSYDKTQCNATTQSIIRRDNFWITYIKSSGYLIYPHCPYDYCHPPEKGVSINLNLPNGADAQCDFNRTGTLCGACKPGLSVSLGISKCIKCQKNWPGLLVGIVIVFIISGIGLIILILLLNLTVAIGTLNTVIFYANIMAANKSALFPPGVSFASVIISWLNLEIGFDVCFFDGLDTYVKTWLQLAFPLYANILALIVILLTVFSSTFKRLVSKKDTVATLATIFLFSYAKLLHVMILAFSSATLTYPDGSRKFVWFPDATVAYFTSKHAAMFLTAILILLAVFVFTFLLLIWKLILNCLKEKIKWIGGDNKVSQFFGAYHAPFVPKHRYWTGLLLIIRVVVYLLSAFNPSGDPRVALLYSVFAVSSLLLYTSAFGIRVYKLWYLNTMESITNFNIVFVCVLSLYTLGNDKNQAAVINTSIGLIIVQVFAVLLYHISKSTNLFSKLKKSKFPKKLFKPSEREQNNNEFELDTAPLQVESIYCEVKEVPFKEQEVAPLEHAQVAMNSPDSQQENDEQKDEHSPISYSQQQISEQDIKMYDSISYVTSINPASSTKYKSDSKLNRHDLPGSGVDRRDPPVCQQKASKTDPMNEHDIKMYESVCYVTTNPRISTKHKSDSVPIPYAVQRAEDDINSSSLTPQDFAPSLPARPLKPTKTKHTSTQNVEDVKMYESVCYNLAKSVPGTSSKHESDSSHIHGSVPVSSSVNPQELDPPPLPLKVMKPCKPNCSQQKQICGNTDKIYVISSGTDAIKTDLSPMPSVKQAADYESPVASNSENHPSLPVCPPKAMKVKPSSTHNEQDVAMYKSVCYNMVNSGTSTTTTKSESPIQQIEHELSGSSVNPYKDSPSPPLCSQHGEKEDGPLKCQ